ncbi:MAG: hypothetical protein AAF321_02210 [Pseudomonadota bacterium]
MTDSRPASAQDGHTFDSSEERLRQDASHSTTPFGEDDDRPTPSDYRNPNMGPGPGGHPGPSGPAGDHPAKPVSVAPSDPDVTREPADADQLKHRPEDADYGSGENALGRTRHEVVNISPDDHVEEAQAIHEKRAHG